MVKSKNETHDLLSELTKTVEAVGVAKTVSVLKFEREKVNIIEDERVHNLIKYVSDKLDIPIEFIFSNNRMWQRKYSLGLLAYLCKKYYGLKDTELKLVLKKDQTILSRYRKLVKGIVGKNKKEKLVLDVKLYLEKMLQTEQYGRN